MTEHPDPTRKPSNIDELIAAATALEDCLSAEGVERAHEWLFAVREVL